MELTHQANHDGHRAQHEGAAGAPLLAPGEHLTLMLVACGYGPTEIAGLRGVEVGGVVVDLGRAVERLGAATVWGAIAAAAERGLLAWDSMAGEPAARRNASYR